MNHPDVFLKDGKYEARISLGMYETEEEASLIAAQMRYILWSSEDDADIINKLGGTIPATINRLPRKQAKDFTVPSLSPSDLTFAAEDDSLSDDGNN